MRCRGHKRLRCEAVAAAQWNGLNHCECWVEDDVCCYCGQSSQTDLRSQAGRTADGATSPRLVPPIRATPVVGL